MTLPPPDISATACLRRLSTLMRDWPGEALCDDGTVRLQNGGGAATPVYWCFNATQEFVALGAMLGSGRPLAGMRSLNQIIVLPAGAAQVLDELADHHAEALLRRFGTRPCIVGGNCQAAPLAWRVAVRLMAAGARVVRLVTLDADLHLPFPGHVRLLFGAESRHYNPALRPPADPLRPPPWHWQRAFRSHECRIVPGPHGRYFTPENLPGLVAALLAPGPQGTPRPPCAAVPDWQVTGATATGLSLAATGAVPADLAVMPIWVTAGGGFLRIAGADWIVPVDASGGMARCRLPRPETPPDDGARVHALPCLPGHGPLIWPIADCPPHQPR